MFVAGMMDMDMDFVLWRVCLILLTFSFNVKRKGYISAGVGFIFVLYNNTFVVLVVA